MFPNGETVTRLRGVPVSDPYSGESVDLDWSTPTELPLEQCGVFPGSSGEPLLDARSMVVSDFTVLAGPGVDVAEADRIVIRGVVCEVVGRPFDWSSPFTGWLPGTVIQANVVEG